MSRGNMRASVAIPALLFSGIFLLLDVTIGLELLTINEAEARRAVRARARTSVASPAVRPAPRRARRRARRRVAVLPAGCTRFITRGITYHRCGTVYYTPYYEGDELVYEEVDAPEE